MKITVLTLFPEMVAELCRHSMIGRSYQKGLFAMELIDIRDFAANKHGQADDYLYGGGAGMLLKPDVVGPALKSVQTEVSHTVYLTPQGKTFDQSMATRLAKENHLVLLSGHYEGIDQRAVNLVDEEISIGDYILTGGEIPALVIMDAVVRLLPGVLGDAQSAAEESFEQGLLEYPQYTRPVVWNEAEVPAVLLSGHHEKIRRWRKYQSLLQTLLKRPDLLLTRDFDEEERQLLEEILFKKREEE